MDPSSAQHLHNVEDHNQDQHQHLQQQPTEEEYQDMNQGASKSYRGHDDDVSGKVFIGGLSWQTTESTLRYYFEKFGELTDVALMMDKRTGKPR
jgi:heterogeneous nuclear ribonucleoprotein A1/A3